MRDEKESQQVLSAVLAAAKKVEPKAEVFAELSSKRQANTRFARGEIISTGDATDEEVTVELSLGQRHASSSTNQTDPASLRALVERTARLARLAPEDPERMPVLGAQLHARVPAAYDEATGKLGAEARADAVRAAVAEGEAKSLDMTGFYELTAETSAQASSAGLRAYHAGTLASFTLTARRPDGQGSGWAGAHSERASELRPAELAKVAAEKAALSANPRRLEPGRYTVVLEPAAVGELLQFLCNSLQARTADEGRSFFSKPGGGTRVGEKLFADGVTLRSDPANPALPSRPYDPDGFPLKPTTWIENGTLKQLAYSRYWASKQGKAPTGEPFAFQLDGGQASREELIAGVKRGVLITRFWYTRWVDPQSMLITGLTRDGVFLIEDGKIAYPVNNFRFNESPVNMLAKADGIGRETVRASASFTRAPALRTHEFNLASISEAI